MPNVANRAEAAITTKQMAKMTSIGFCKLIEVMG